MLRSLTQHLGHRKENSFKNELGVGLAVVGCAVVGLAVVGFAVVGFAVAGFAVVGLAVVKLGSPSGGARHVL